MYTLSGICNLLGNIMKEHKVKKLFFSRSGYHERLSEYFAINFYYQPLYKHPQNPVTDS